MKYGVLYYKNTDNIGDDIQSYAQMRFLPHVDYYIDREALNCFIPDEKEYVSVIMNAWYIHNKLAWPPSPYIDPLLISMHFTSLESIDIGDKYLQNFGGEYLKKYEPIGARDMETKKRLEKNGIDAYFSGCMTLTLPKFENIEKKDKICLVDLTDDIIKKVKENTISDTEILTHWLNQEEIAKKDINQRMQDVENLLKKYQEARLVITNRLHVALPCIALGTPVILIHKKNYEKDRLETFLKYMDNYVDTEFLEMDITELLKNPKANNEEYLQIRKSLIEKCESFVSKNEELNTENLPDVKEYYENYVSKIEWYRVLHEETYNKAKEMVFDYEKKINNLYSENKAIFEAKQNVINEKEELLKEIEKYKQEQQFLIREKEELIQEKEKANNELMQVYNSKGWKFLEKIRKIKSKNN